MTRADPRYQDLRQATARALLDAHKQFGGDDGDLAAMAAAIMFEIMLAMRDLRGLDDATIKLMIKATLVLTEGRLEAAPAITDKLAQALKPILADSYRPGGPRKAAEKALVPICDLMAETGSISAGLTVLSMLAFSIIAGLADTINTQPEAALAELTNQIRKRLRETGRADRMAEADHE